MRWAKVALGNYSDRKALNGEFRKLGTNRREQRVERLSGIDMTAGVQLLHRVDIRTRAPLAQTILNGLWGKQD